MTIEMQMHLEREMDDALSLTEPERRKDAIMTVLSHQLRALIDCQRKTADRVKALVAEKDAAENKIKGAKLLAGLIKALVAVGGPTAAVYICKILNIL